MPNTHNSSEPHSLKARIDPKMLGILVCPKTRGPLTYDKATNELISKKAKLAYPIRDGVPILLESAAKTLD
ncbi:MAG: Trm112 family protein [Litorimonas sp.]